MKNVEIYFNGNPDVCFDILFFSIILFTMNKKNHPRQEKIELIGVSIKKNFNVLLLKKLTNR